MKVSEERRNQIVKDIAANFRCFGKGSRPVVFGNPISDALADKPPQFAAGVDVKEVVDYVIKQLAGAKGATV